MANQQMPAVVQAKRTVRDLITSEKTKSEIAKVLPKHLTPERMTRVALTATMKNPTLLECTPESLMNSLLICSQAGLEPDGRLAHLIPYGKTCQVIFDYKGLVTLALRNGAESVYADKVCEFDEFEAYVQDGIKKLNHKPNWKNNRGTVSVYYAVCKRAGEVDFEVMTVDEVQDIRKRSRAANNGPWVTDFDEMGKKTVLRRMSKRWDLLPEIRDVINADDDTPAGTVQAPMSRPMFSAPSDRSAIDVPAAQSEPVEQSQSEEPQPDAGEGTDLAPQSSAPVEQPGNGRQNYLKAVRALCAMAHIKEGELLGFMSQTGVTDGSASTLEEVAMSQPEALKLAHDHWADISGKILTARKSTKKGQE